MLRLRRRRRRRAGAAGGAGTTRLPRSLLGCGWAPSGRIASASGEAGTGPVAPYRTRPSPPVARGRLQNFAGGALGIAAVLTTDRGAGGALVLLALVVFLGGRGPRP